MQEAKLAGAGGGDFAIVIARDEDAAGALEQPLAQRSAGGNVGVSPWAIAETEIMAETGR